MRINKYLYPLIIILLLIAGVFIRTVKFPDIPTGFNQDEAGSAYESYSLLETGKDRWGNELPAYFPSWGSGQNVLLAYLTMPFIKSYGLTIFSARIVSLLLGLLSLPLFYYCIRPLGKFSAWLGLLFLVSAPWHFMLSRWALESNILPFFMLLGCTALSRALYTGRKSWIMLCLIPFALSLYAYGTTIVVLPLFFILLLILNFKRIQTAWQSWLLSLAVFLCVSFPFLLFFVKNYILNRTIPWTDHLFFSTPLLPSNRLQQINKASWKAVLYENSRFALAGFDDGSDYNLLQGFNLLFAFALPLAIIASIIFIYQYYKNKSFIVNNQNSSDIILSIFFAWAVAATSLAFLFFLNVNRFNHFYLPCLVLAAWGIGFVLNTIKRKDIRRGLKLLVVAFIIIENGLAIHYYFTAYPYGRIKEDFNTGLQEAFAVVNTLPTNQVWIDIEVSQAYTYTLFFLRYPPAKFQQDVNVEVVNGVYKVNQFGRYVFYEEYLVKQKRYGYLSRKNAFPNSQEHPKTVLFTNEYWEVGIRQ